MYWHLLTRRTRESRLVLPRMETSSGRLWHMGYVHATTVPFWKRLPHHVEVCVLPLICACDWTKKGLQRPGTFLSAGASIPIFDQLHRLVGDITKLEQRPDSCIEIVPGVGQRIPVDDLFPRTHRPNSRKRIRELRPVWIRVSVSNISSRCRKRPGIRRSPPGHASGKCIFGSRSS